MLVSGFAVALAAFGWGIVEPLVPPRLGQRFAAEPWTIGAIFTAASIVYALAAPVVAAASRRGPLRFVVGCGTMALAISIVLLGVVDGIIPVAITICLISVAFAFTLNPASAELADAVDRLQLSGYASVYAVFNVAYSIGMIATTGFASAAFHILGYVPVLLWISLALIVCTPFLLLRVSTSTASDLN